jgi:hypothetical protein
VLAADAFAAPAMAPPQPLAMDALAQQTSFPSPGPLPDRFAQPPQPWLASTPPTPDPLSTAAGAGGQGLLQSAAFDSWSKPAAPTGTLARPGQTGPDPAGLTLAQQRTTLPDGVPDMIPPAMLVHGTAPGTSARQVPPKSAHREAVAFGKAPNGPQAQQLRVVPELFMPLPWSPHGIVNRPIWFDRIERVGERSRQGQVSSKGAVGPMQVRIIGARDAARILKIQLDLKRLKTDPVYSGMLGKVYANSLLDRYGGNVVLATAAYNMGMGNLHHLMGRIGDPRSGRILDAEFVQAMDRKETRDYIRRVVYGETWEQQNPPPQRQQQQRQQEQSRRRPPPLLGNHR